MTLSVSVSEHVTAVGFVSVQENNYSLNEYIPICARVCVRTPIHINY